VGRARDASGPNGCLPAETARRGRRVHRVLPRARLPRVRAVPARRLPRVRGSPACAARGCPTCTASPAHGGGRGSAPAGGLDGGYGVCTDRPSSFISATVASWDAWRASEMVDESGTLPSSSLRLCQVAWTGPHITPGTIDP